jgi:hypothetical protein
MKDRRSTYIRSKEQRPRPYKKDPANYHTISAEQAARAKRLRAIEDMRDSLAIEEELREVWE